MPSLPINLTGNLGEAQIEAIGELEKLGKFYYNLIYLHRSEGGDADALQQWIQTNQFPPGFPKIIPAGRQALSDCVTQLKESGWENVTGGIGRTREFAEVLVKNRIKAVVLHDPEDKEGFPPQSRVGEELGQSSEAFVTGPFCLGKRLPARCDHASPHRMFSPLRYPRIYR